MWPLTVGVFIYLISPLVFATLLVKFRRNTRLDVLPLIIGLACAPLILALILYGLFAIMPGLSPWVYFGIVGGLNVIGIIWLRKEVLALLSSLLQSLRLFLTGLGKTKLLTTFIIGTVFFIFVRIVSYPPTWGDVYEYIEQAYVYSQDRGIWRLGTNTAFTEDSTHYVMNPAIRPGIPMLYSLFFLAAPPAPNVLVLTQVIYFYYFVLLLFSVSYGGKLIGLKGQSLIWPSVLTISSFYVLRFTIFGAKEIILMTLALLSLYALDELSKRKEVDWKYLILMSLTMGIGTFINFSGTIIAGIIGFIFLIWVRYPIRIRILVAAALTGLILILGGMEAWRGATDFIFNPSPLSQGKEVVDAAKVKQAELANYQLSAKDVLWRGKLQAFTQPQFFGFLFTIWLILIIVSWMKGHNWTDLEKLLLLYTGIYFLMIMDPFSLNPHPYAYVLSISPKYSLMLVPMISLMAAGRRETVLYIQSKVPRKLIYYLGVMAILLLPPVRSLAIGQMMKIVEALMVLTQETEYYRSLLNSIMIGIGIASLLLVLTAKYWQRHYAKLAAIGGLVLPTIFLLNSNFSIWGTLRHALTPMPTRMIEGEIDQNNKNAFMLVNYINSELPPDAQIVFLFRDNRIGFFIKNRERLHMPYNAYRIADIEQEADYFVYTEKEKGESILRSRGIRELASIGPYIIAEGINEKE